MAGYSAGFMRGGLYMCVSAFFFFFLHECVKVGFALAQRGGGCSELSAFGDARKSRKISRR